MAFLKYRNNPVNPKFNICFVAYITTTYFTYTARYQTIIKAIIKAVIQANKRA